MPAFLIQIFAGRGNAVSVGAPAPVGGPIVIDSREFSAPVVISPAVVQIENRGFADGIVLTTPTVSIENRDFSTPVVIKP